jgi:transcriptional regulator with XRE-family HTH domain
MLNTINIGFGKKVKKTRQKLGMTQEELAEAIKTSYKYIQRIEGKTPPDIRLSTIERIAKALNVQISQLLRF